MLSYYTPPAASAGIYRTLRFVRYLPEFGWRPLLVTVSPEALHHKRRDSSLEKLMPEGTVVTRTGVWRPWQSAANVAKMLLRRGDKNTAEEESAVSSPANSNVTLAKRSRFTRVTDGTRQLLFETPDAQVGWMVPAIRAALPLVRKFRPQVIYSTGPPHSSHLIAIALKKITGIPVVIDFRDPWARTDWDSNGSNSVRRNVQRRLERKCVSAANCVIRIL